MNMITYILPNLQEDPQAGIACNSLANTGAWAGDEEFMYTYVNSYVNGHILTLSFT